jgi:uncharacterized protein
VTGPADRILPRPGPESIAYWDGCRAGELRLQHCLDCGHVQFYPRSACTRCRSPRIEWRAACGRGRVESFTWVHVPLAEAWESEVPYAVALIRLDEGPLMMSNVRECAIDALRIGLRVHVVFEPHSDEIHLPQFRPERAD